MPKMCYCRQQLIDVSSTRLHRRKLTSDKSCISICDVNYADEEASARNVTHLFVVIVFWNKEVSVSVVLIFPHQHQNTKKIPTWLPDWQKMFVPTPDVSRCFLHTCETRRWHEDSSLPVSSILRWHSIWRLSRWRQRFTMDFTSDFILLM